MITACNNVFLHNVVDEQYTCCKPLVGHVSVFKTRARDSRSRHPKKERRQLEKNDSTRLLQDIHQSKSFDDDGERSWSGVQHAYIMWEMCRLRFLFIIYPLRGNHQCVWFEWNNYRKIILITGVLSLSAGVNVFFIVYCKHTTHARAHTLTHARTRVRTHVYTRAHTQPLPPSPSAAQANAIRWRLTNRDGPLRMRQCRSLAIQINTRTGDPIPPRFWKFFAYKKIARPNSDANSWHDILSDDANRHFPRRSSKNCDLQFANADRQTYIRQIIV